MCKRYSKNWGYIYEAMQHTGELCCELTYINTILDENNVLQFIYKFLDKMTFLQQKCMK